MIPLVLLVAVIGSLCYGFYAWARKRGLAGDRPAGSTVEHPGHISLLAEAVSYVGAILILAGGIAAISRRWGDVSAWGHVGISAAAATFFLAVGGVLFFSAREAALQRLVGVLWFVSVGAVAGAVGLLTLDVNDASVQVSVLVVGSSAAAYAAVLWMLRKQPLQNVAVFAGLVVTLCGAIATIGSGDAPSLAFALTLWTFGLIWVLAGWRRWVTPWWTTVPLGILLALLAPTVALDEHGWLYAIGLATAVTVIAVSVALRNTPMLAMGALALFGYVTSMVIRYFADSLGVPAALSLTGAFILVLVAVGARLRKAMQPSRPDHAPREKLGHAGSVTH